MAEGEEPGASDRSRSGSARTTDAPEDAPPPRPYPYRAVTLQYELLYGASPMRLGTVTQSLRIEGNQYAIEQIGEGSGLVGALYERAIGGQLVNRSAGTLSAAGFVPGEFFAQRGRRDRRDHADFDWAHGVLTLDTAGGSRALRLVDGTQDLVSMLHQLYFMGPLPARGRMLATNGRTLSEYAFQRVAEEMTETPLGACMTVHLVRTDSGGDRAELWLDEGHALLPARIVFEDRDGLRLQFVLIRRTLKG